MRMEVERQRNLLDSLSNKAVRGSVRARASKSRSYDAALSHWYWLLAHLRQLGTARN